MLNDILKNYNNSYKAYIPFEDLWADGVVLNKTNSFMVAYKIRFHDLDYLEEEDYEYILKRINQSLRRLPDGYSVHMEVQRNKSNQYPKKDLKNSPYPTQIIEAIRENSIINQDFYITEYFLTITYTLSNEIISTLDNMINLNPKKRKSVNKEDVIKEIKKELQGFLDTVEIFETQYKTAVISIDRLLEEELLGFLYTTINMEKKEKVAVPTNGSMFLDEYLTMSTLKKDKEDSSAMINDEYIKAVTINHFPTYTYPRIFNALENLNFEYRYVNRFIILSREEALEILKNSRLYFNMKLKSLMQWIIDAVKQEDATRTDVRQLEKLNEINILEQELKNGDICYGYYTFTLLIKDKNLERLEKKVQEVKKVLSVLDFVAGEDKYNLIDSIIGAIPSNIVNNIRKLPMHTKNVATLMPMSSLYIGDKYNKHLKDVALLTTKTDKELFYLNLHNTDVGHTSVIGPTGYGKSFLLNFLASEFCKYEFKKLITTKDGKSSYIKKKAQVFFFDVGGSSRVLSMLNGGKFYDLGQSNEIGQLEVSFQPLANIDDEKEKEWALSWITILLEQEKIEVNAQIRSLIWEALKSLSSTPKNQRTLSNFTAYLQDSILRSALSIYCGNEAYGKYFDSDYEDMEDNNFVVFEMNEIISNEKVIIPLLDYIFHKIERDKLDGTPTLIIADEFQVLIKNEKMKEKIEKWLNTLRKYNASVILSTQSLKHLSESSIAASIIDACKTNIYLPNERALSTWKELYQSFNLNLKEIEEIKEGEKKQDYFIKRTDGSRMFQLHPSRTEIALVGSSSKNDQLKILQLREEVDQTNLPEEKKIKELNKKWINYKYQLGEIPYSEVQIYQHIFKE